VVMLHPTTKAPIIETGKESKTTIASRAIPTDPAAAEEMFLALMHQGAVALWEREVKVLWVPSEKTQPPSSSTPSKA
jgi:hypothetical protein